MKNSGNQTNELKTKCCRRGNIRPGGKGKGNDQSVKENIKNIQKISKNLWNLEWGIENTTKNKNKNKNKSENNSYTERNTSQRHRKYFQ